MVDNALTHTFTHRTSRRPHAWLTTPHHSDTRKVFNPAEAGAALCCLQLVLLILIVRGMEQLIHYSLASLSPVFCSQQTEWNRQMAASRKTEVGDWEGRRWREVLYLAPFTCRMLHQRQDRLDLSCFFFYLKVSTDLRSKMRWFQNEDVL